MDNSASEWSSGCESGWTVYLDESSHSPNQYPTSALYHQTHNTTNADDEEDLSMVSDASSGPPHFHYGVGEEDEVQYCHGRAPFSYPPSSSSSEKSKKKMMKKKEKETTSANNQKHSFLDDTASSPAFTYPNMCTDNPSNNQPSMNHLFGFSQDNGFAGNSALGNQFGYWKSSPQPRPQDSTESSRSRGRRRG